MNRNGNPRLLQYWRDYYRRRRDARYKLGLTVRGTPRKLPRYTDPVVRHVVQKQNAMRYYHAHADRRYAAGLRADGKPRKRINFPRHQHADFINRLESKYSQEQQAEQRRLHQLALQRKHQRALRQKNIAAGLTSKGAQRKRGRISPTELAWRQLRASMNIDSSSVAITTPLSRHLKG